MFLLTDISLPVSCESSVHCAVIAGHEVNFAWNDSKNVITYK